MSTEEEAGEGGIGLLCPQLTGSGNQWLASVEDGEPTLIRRWCNVT